MFILSSQACILHYARDESFNYLFTYLLLQIRRIHAKRSCQSRNGGYHHFDNDVPYGFLYCHTIYTSFQIVKGSITCRLSVLVYQYFHIYLLFSSLDDGKSRAVIRRKERFSDPIRDCSEKVTN